MDREMPKYQCKKQVWALKIKDIKPTETCENCESDGSYIITPVEDGYALFRVDYKYIDKHAPVIGGYYVVYKGGYVSFSPADAFDEGYDLINL